MESEITMWGIFFMLFIGLVWVTILHKIKQVERAVKGLSGDNDGQKS